MVAGDALETEHNCQLTLFLTLLGFKKIINLKDISFRAENHCVCVNRSEMKSNYVKGNVTLSGLQVSVKIFCTPCSAENH